MAPLLRPWLTGALVLGALAWPTVLAGAPAASPARPPHIAVVFHASAELLPQSKIRAHGDRAEDDPGGQSHVRRWRARDRRGQGRLPGVGLPPGTPNHRPRRSPPGDA